MKQERVKYCDALRLVAIVSVVMIHVLAGYRDFYVQNNRLYYSTVTFFDSITRTGVPIFFMITGAFMLTKKDNIKYSEFLKKRLPKLCIPFIILSIGYYLYDGFLNNVPMSILDFFEKFTSPGGVKYHFWFMYIIIIIYLFIPFLKTMVQNIKKNDLRNLILLIFIFGNLLKTINLFSTKMGVTLFTGFILNDLIIYTNYLFLGYYLYNYEVKRKNRSILYTIGIISILLLPLADALYIDNVRNDVLVTANSIFPFVPSIAIFLLFKYNYNKWKVPKIIEKFANKLAPLTFYIYMIHVIIMECVERQILKLWFPNRFIERGFYYLVIFILTFCSSYIVSIFLNWLYNKGTNVIKITIQKLRERKKANEENKRFFTKV